jgi:hypothetical protein
MARLSTALLLLLVIPDLGVTQPVSVHYAFLKAQNYLDMSADKRQTFAMGFIDGMSVAPAFGLSDQGTAAVKALGSCLEGMNQAQIAAIIEKYIRNHPEHWHYELEFEGFSAMKDNCHF